MGLITKLAWFALPALAVCGVLLQVSSQGTGTNPGGNANGGLDIKFPEDREWLKDAGLQDALRYADRIKSNVGLSEKDIGMTMKKYRELERAVATAVLARDPKDVANDIKRKKYGITNIGEGAPDLPPGTDFRALYRNNSPEYQPALAEAKNIMAVPSSINKDMGQYVLDRVDEVLAGNSISPAAPSNRLLRASLFARGVFYLFNGVSSRSPELSLGPGVGRTLSEKGVFAMDLPRGRCSPKSATFVRIVNSQSKDLGVFAGWTSSFSRIGNWQEAEYLNLKVNHANAVVAYQGHNFVEGYDPTNQLKLDSKDPDARATWALTCTQFLVPLANTPKLSVGGSVMPYATEDPISLIPKQEFMSIPKELSGSVLRATSELRHY